MGLHAPDVEEGHLHVVDVEGRLDLVPVLDSLLVLLIQAKSVVLVREGPVSHHGAVLLLTHPLEPGDLLDFALVPILVIHDAAWALDLQEANRGPGDGIVEQAVRGGGHITLGFLYSLLDGVLRVHVDKVLLGVAFTNNASLHSSAAV